MSSKIQITKICQHCGQEFTAKTTVTKFCSHTCANRNYKQRNRTKKVEQVESTIKQKQEFNFSQLNDKQYLSIAETCQLLGASRMTIYRQIKKGTIKAVKLGRRTIINRSEIEKLFSS